MSTGASGRPKGTQNRAGHAAGGVRPGAGRKKKARVEVMAGNNTEDHVDISGMSFQLLTPSVVFQIISFCRHCPRRPCRPEPEPS